MCICVSYVYLLYFYVYWLYLCVFVVLLCVFVVLLCVFVYFYVYLLYFYVYWLYLCVFVYSYVYLLYFYVYLLYYVYIDILTLDAGLMARSQYPEGLATGHLDTGFSWFPCVYKRMLRWFPSFQVATTCFSCSPPT